MRRARGRAAPHFGCKRQTRGQNALVMTLSLQHVSSTYTVVVILEARTLNEALLSSALLYCGYSVRPNSAGCLISQSSGKYLMIHIYLCWWVMNLVNYAGMARSALCRTHPYCGSAPVCAPQGAYSTYSCRARGITYCTVYSKPVHIKQKGTVINHHYLAFSTGSMQKILFLKLLFETELCLN